MPNYNFDFMVTAETPEAASVVMGALAALANKLTPQELAKIAEVVQHKPKTLKLAKKYLGL
jgi:glycine betaine/choline ABC-type transport system substrate-binding protein